jgi:hypothetical protein
MSAPIVFDPEDLSQILPAPGYYSATVTAARFRRSARGNRMLHLALGLEGVSPGFQCIADYFVLEGGSDHGRSVARRRLVQLYHACGLRPEDGEQVLPSQLLDARLQIKVDQVEWDNEMRLRILAYRPAWPVLLEGPAASEIPQEDTPRG